MSRSCYLHIGMPKCGSTAIQDALCDYDNGKVAYSQLFRQNHSLAFAVLFKNQPKNYRVLKRNGTSQKKITRLKQRFKKNLTQDFIQTKKDTIFSGEDICKTLSRCEIESLMALLSKHYDSVRIIAYIRPFLSFCLSAFQQRVKGGHNGGLEIGIPGYRRIFKPWIKALGPAEIEFVKFEPTAFGKGGILADFCPRVGAIPPADVQMRENEALSAESLAMLYCFNHFVGRQYGSARLMRAHNKLVKRIRSLGHSPMTFSSAAAAPLLEQEQRDISWMENISGFHLREPLKSALVSFDIEEDIFNLGGQQVGLLMDALKIKTPPSGSPPEQCAKLVEHLRHSLA